MPERICENPQFSRKVRDSENETVLTSFAVPTANSGCAEWRTVKLTKSKPGVTGQVVIAGRPTKSHDCEDLEEAILRNVITDYVRKLPVDLRAYISRLSTDCSAALLQLRSKNWPASYSQCSGKSRPNRCHRGLSRCQLGSDSSGINHRGSDSYFCQPGRGRKRNSAGESHLSGEILDLCRPGW